MSEFLPFRGCWPRLQSRVPGIVVVLGIAVLMAGAHALPLPSRTGCLAGTSPGIRVELLLGRNSGQMLGVSAERFQAFLDREVTPRFPDGFTVQDANGQWREQGATEVMREPSYALMIVLRQAGPAAPKLKAITEAYKREFNQQSVLISLSPTCFAF